MSAIWPYRCTGTTARVRAAAPRLDRSGVDAVVVLGDVDEDGHATGLRDRLDGGDERRCRDDDLVARLDPEATRPSLSASRPLARPTQYAVPQ